MMFHLCMQCSALDVQLKAAYQEISQLNDQLAAMQHASHGTIADSPDNAVLAAVQGAEAIALRAELEQRQQEIAALHMQLDSATNASAQVKRSKLR